MWVTNFLRFVIFLFFQGGQTAGYLGNDTFISRVSCQKGPTRHAYAWQIGPFWQDTLDMIWMWFNDSNMWFCRIENFHTGEINEQMFNDPHPGTSKVNSSITYLPAKRPFLTIGFQLSIERGNTFLWKAIIVCWCRFHLSLFRQAQLPNVRFISALFAVCTRTGDKLLPEPTMA